MPKRSSALVLLALLAGCDARERLTFPSNDPGGSGQGPVTTILEPSVDSVLTAGDEFIAGGRTVDPDGVDSVYFEAVGGGQGFLPVLGFGEDTVRFGIPIQTSGRSGATVIVRVRGVDVLGNQGLTATRQITIE